MNIGYMGFERADLTKLDNLKKTSIKAKEEKKLQEACKDFEALFINQLMKEMRKTVKKSGFIDGGNAEKIFQSMLDEKYSETMAESGDLGLGQMMFRQLKNRL